MTNSFKALLLATSLLAFAPVPANSTALSDLTAATTTNTIDNGNNLQTWQWNGLTGGAGLELLANTTTGGSGFFYVSVGGANSNSNISTHAAEFSDSHTGTGSSDYGLLAHSNGGAHNYGVYGQAWTTGGSGSTAIYDTGVWGDATDTTGATIGVLGTNKSSSGYAGYFNNSNGGYAGAFMGGNVGVGIASPLYPLDVYNGKNSAPAYMLRLQSNTTNIGTANDNALMAFQHFSNAHSRTWVVGTGSYSLFGAQDNFGIADQGTTPLFVVQAGGNVGIATTTPAYPLDVVGDIRTSTCLRYSSGSLGTCTSDAKLKRDVKPFDLGLAAVSGLKPVTFYYNGLAGNPDDGRKQIGLIAQDVEKVAPSLVVTQSVRLHPRDSKDTSTADVKAVDYGAVSYMLINAVKELKAENDSLRSEFEAYKAAHK